MTIDFSEKQLDFLRSEAVVDILEGTTAGGKTTVANAKIGLKVADSDQKLHIISGNDVGVVEKNIINAELGLLTIFDGLMEYHPRGKGDTTIPHLTFQTPKGEKIIYVLGYADESKWKKALGGQYGCVFIDEINTAKMSYVTQVAMRCDYLLATLNPDNPDKEIYHNFINAARPVEKYKDDAPRELIEMLDQPHKEGWNWWFFSFKDNPWVTPERLKRIKEAHVPGTADYKHYILGLRGKAAGVVFSNFDRKRHTMSKEAAKRILRNRGRNKERFITYSAGLDTSYSQKSNDTIAMSFTGITNFGRIFLLDELVLTNKGKRIPIAPADVVKAFVRFLEKNRLDWGEAEHTYIDSADQATIQTFNSAIINDETVRCGNDEVDVSAYTYNNAYKQLRILDRINMQLGWLENDKMVVLDHCKEYLKEINLYSWDEKEKEGSRPVDKHDHMINSFQYSWIPYLDQIG